LKLVLKVSLERKFDSVLVMIVFTTLILSQALLINPSFSLNVDETIKIIEGDVPINGGMNSIRAVTDSSMFGVLYRKESNPAPIYLVTDFSQNLAKVEIFSRQGTLIDRTTLRSRNTFVIQLLNIVEFNDKNQNGFFDRINELVFRRVINLSEVIFNVQKNLIVNDSDPNKLAYEFTLCASNLQYSQGISIPVYERLDSLNFSFVLQVEKEEVRVRDIPLVKIRPKDDTLIVSRDLEQQPIKALKITPRLKFSCNISGWDFTSENSRLLLDLRVLSYEEILTTFKKLDGIPITRDIIERSGLTSRIEFLANSTGRITNFYLDQSQNETTRTYEKYSFAQGSKLSLGCNIRKFLNFSWAPTLNVDGKSYPIKFQLLDSGRLSTFIRDQSRIKLPSAFIRGVFIIPQGDEISYDPEIQVEEINPIITAVSPPNRSLLETNSLLILVSGLFFGVLVIFRQKVMR